MTLTEFVLARITEKEKAGCIGEGEYKSCSDYSEAREAECAAMRRIVAQCDTVVESHCSDDFTADWLAENVLMILAQLDQGHPDYQPKWARDDI